MFTSHSLNVIIFTKYYVIQHDVIHSASTNPGIGFGPDPRAYALGLASPDYLGLTSELEWTELTWEAVFQETDVRKNDPIAMKLVTYCCLFALAFLLFDLSGFFLFLVSLGWIVSTTNSTVSWVVPYMRTWWSSFAGFLLKKVKSAVEVLKDVLVKRSHTEQWACKANTGSHKQPSATKSLSPRFTCEPASGSFWWIHWRRFKGGGWIQVPRGGRSRDAENEPFLWFWATTSRRLFWRSKRDFSRVHFGATSES